MQINIYQDFLNILDKKSIVNLFFDTLIETNHDFKFFVDWKKVKANVEKYKLELNILNSLIRQKEFKKALKDILIRYPEVLPCFPLLIAVREKQFKLVEDFTSSKAQIIDYDFTPRKLDEAEIDKIINFVNQTKLKDFFCKSICLQSSGLFDGNRSWS